MVEGKSDYEFIQKIIARFYAQDFKKIKILFAGDDTVKQRESISAIDEVFRPLLCSSPIYKDRIIVLLDKPNKQQKAIYKQFKKGYPYLFDHKQVFELDACSLEAYYPAQWKKNLNYIEQQEGGKVMYAKKSGREDRKV